MSNNVFSDVSRDIASSTGSYHVPTSSLSSLPDPGLYLWDFILLVMTCFILLWALKEYKSTPSSSAPLSSNK